jgi:hypothetical protein
VDLAADLALRHGHRELPQDVELARARELGLL